MKTIQFREAIQEAMSEEMRRAAKVVLMLRKGASPSAREVVEAIAFARTSNERVKLDGAPRDGTASVNEGSGCARLRISHSADRACACRYLAVLRHRAHP